MTVRRAVLLTGGTGTLGSLAATALLRDGGVDVVAPVRAHHPGDAVASAVAREMRLSGGEVDPGWAERLHQVALPDGADDPDGPDPLDGLDEVVDRYAADELIHCAGCLSYFDEAALRAVNVEMTRRFVQGAERWGMSRVVHISTAFACGFVGGLVPERLHDEPSDDPTFYTESKRQGERIVAGSGVPFVILRPSVVIGDSRDGHYCGPRYGLYQLWSGVERFLLDEWHRDTHYVAPQRTIPLLHQDAYMSALLATWRHLPAGSICHLTSHGGPDVRELADLFVHRHLRPATVRYYERLADVPLDSIPSAQRAFLGMAAVNIEISSHPWRFDTATLDGLVADGLDFTDATLETVERCQEAYFAGSERLNRYRDRFAGSFPGQTRVLT
ncbi:MAG: SDR family oxidoreductase [Acidimicrobiales bacterium]